MTTKRKGRPIDLPSPWYEMALALGSVKNLANALGTSTRSIQRYAAYQTEPDAYVKKNCNELAKALNIPLPFEDRHKRTGT